MTIQQAISVVDTLEQGWYGPPVYYYIKKSQFIYDSLLRSGMEEIKYYLSEHCDQNPITAIEEFRHQMDVFACRTKSGDASFMFSVYYDVATSVLDVMLEKEW